MKRYSNERLPIFQGNKRASPSEKEIFTQTLKEVLHKIIEYTSSLDQVIKTSFDLEEEKDIKRKDSSSSDSTNSNDENEPENLLKDINIYTFIDFVIEKFEFETNLIILAMMVLDKALKRKFVLTDKNVHKFMLVVLMVTHKTYAEEIVKARCFAKALGISAEKLLELEFEFMDLIEFKVNINDTEFIPYKERMKNFWEENHANFGYHKAL